MLNDVVLNGARFNHDREIEAGSGSLLRIGQNVIYINTGLGSLLSIEQNVTVTEGGVAIIYICQDVQL